MSFHVPGRALCSALDRPVVITWCCALAFALASLPRIHGAGGSIEDLVTGGDDWNSYAAYAQDLLRNGLLLERIEGNYVQPAGFLYSYFVAACLAVSGNSLGFVYFVQAMLLGLSVAMSWSVFRGMLTRRSRTVLLLCLLLFAVLDVYAHYTFRLLSENLALFLVALFFVQLKNWSARNSPSATRTALCGITLALVVLTRPNLALFALLMVVLLGRPGPGRKVTTAEVVSFLVFLVGVTSLLALRNFLVSGTLHVLPVDSGYLRFVEGLYAHAASAGPHAVGFHILKNILFCSGFLNVLEPSYAIRPHWILMTLGVLFFFRQAVRHRGRLSLLELSTGVFVITFHAVLITFSQLSNYGFRMLVPGLFITLGLSIKGFELVFPAKGRWPWRKQQQP
ncbi:MAG: hypothetical protein KBH07_06160 [Flavobacteriales bacterium]|nr:hypothetical protein [Flavobacteriales bacterium]